VTDTGRLDPAALAATRDSLHAVAEHVLAAVLHRATGRIGLRPAPGGFATPTFDGPAGPTRVAVDGTDLVVDTGGDRRRAPLTTLRAAAELAGVPPGAPGDVYPPATPLDLDRPLPLDADVARRLAAFYAGTAEALRTFLDRHGEEGPAPITLWPEHLDLATSVGEVNYGGSPGDDGRPLPYLYVGPWAPPPTDDFWNEPFGAARTWPGDVDAEEAVAFFDEGRARLAGAR
jgi:hypothetical protein